MLNNLLRVQQEREMQAQFDKMSAKQIAEKAQTDPISEKAFIYMNGQMRLMAIHIVFALTSIIQEDASENELFPSEVLDGLMIESFSDDDDDDDIDDFAKIALSAHISDVLASLGVSDDLINDSFDEDSEIADSAIEEVTEIVLENMPDDDDLDDFIAQFAFGEEESEKTQFDKLSAGKKTVKKVGGKSLTYKAVKAVRNGKVVTVNKRVGGKVKLSAKQKSALKKARRKAMTGSALRKRIKSFMKGDKLGLHE